MPIVETLEVQIMESITHMKINLLEHKSTNRPMSRKLQKESKKVVKIIDDYTLCTRVE